MSTFKGNTEAALSADCQNSVNGQRCEDLYRNESESSLAPKGKASGRWQDGWHSFVIRQIFIYTSISQSVEGATALPSSRTR